MNRAAWAAPTTPEIAAKRAAGRRAYNSRRQSQAFFRRHEVWKVLIQQGRLYEKGIKIRLATMLGISYRQVCRDIETVLKDMHPCPHCGAPARLRNKC